MSENALVIIAGIPGVGKTTVVKKAIEIAEKEKMDISEIVFGTVMMDIAEEKANIQDRDKLRTIPPSQQKDIQREAGERIASQVKEHQITIVDTHFAVKTSIGAYLQGIPSWVSDALQPSLLVLIETDPNNILKRREWDKDRERDQDSIRDLKEHQEINRVIAATIGQKTGALLSIITNEQGKAEEAGKELFEILKKIQSKKK
jgi:adenylate kinase